MSEYISKRELIDFLNEEMKQDRPDDLKIRNIQRYIDDATLDEKEIIRKVFERVMERLERELESANNELKRTIERNPMQTDFALGYKMAIKNAIGIVRKECGINE